jgi:hypothetical protein
MSSRIKSGFSLRAAATASEPSSGRDDFVTGSLQFQGNGFQDDLVVIHHQNLLCLNQFSVHIKLKPTKVCFPLISCEPDFNKSRTVRQRRISAL